MEFLLKTIVFWCPLYDEEWVVSSDGEGDLVGGVEQGREPTQLLC